MRKTDARVGKREEILRAALTEFSKRPYQAVSVNKIIKDAKTSKGNFYHHFASKEDLYVTLIQASIQVKWAFIEKGMQGQEAVADPNDVFELLSQQVKVGMEFAKRHPAYYELGKRFADEKGNPIYDIVGKGIDLSATDRIAEMIAAAYDDNRFNDKLSKAFVVRILSYHFQNFHQILSQSDDDFDEVLANLEQLIEFLRNGLERPREVEDR
jgi:AcrR family transcriptional regulator